MALLQEDSAIIQDGQNQTAYRVLARKYRPQTFHDLIGQQAMVQTLDNAYRSGRLAHAFMLTGVRGVGKTTTARIVARALNCENPQKDDTYHMNPCGACKPCQSILLDRHVDVMEMDAATRTGVDDIREIIEGVKYAPVSAKYKIYIIDEIHMLSKAAFNALLKTLEEPPARVKFIFATTEIRKVPLTVLSRCQRFDLRRVSIPELHAYFKTICDKESVGIDEEALTLISRAADGSVRDGLSLLDQAIAMSADVVTANAVKYMLGLSDRSDISALYNDILHAKTEEVVIRFLKLYENGADSQVILQDLMDLTHSLTRLLVCGEETEILQDIPNWAVDFFRQAKDKLSLSALNKIWQILVKGLKEFNQVPLPHQAAEMILIRLCYASNLPDPVKLLKTYYDQDFSAEKMASLSQDNTKNEPSPEQKKNLKIEPVPSEANQKIEEHKDYQFNELVQLFSTHNEVLIYGTLFTAAKPVRIEKGVFEFSIDQELPKNTLTKISSLLKKWTGEHWMVTLSKKEGGLTLAQEEEKIKNQEIEDVKKSPLINEILTVFPEAEITKIYK